MREISLALVWFEAVERLANAFPGRLKGSFRGFAHEMFELVEDLLSLPKGRWAELARGSLSEA
jgi:hypothetical protein